MYLLSFLCSYFLIFFFFFFSILSLLFSTIFLIYSHSPFLKLFRSLLSLSSLSFPCFFLSTFRMPQASFFPFASLFIFHTYTMLWSKCNVIYILLANNSSGYFNKFIRHSNFTPWLQNTFHEFSRCSTLWCFLCGHDPPIDSGLDSSLVHCQTYL